MTWDTRAGRCHRSGSSAGSATTQIVNGSQIRSTSALLMPDSVATRIVSKRGPGEPGQ